MMNRRTFLSASGSLVLAAPRKAKITAVITVYFRN